MKLFFKKAWIFVKTYWYIILLLCLIPFALFLDPSGSKIKKIFKLIKLEREVAKKEVEIIEKSLKNQNKQVEEKIDKYHEDKEKLDKTYKESLEKIEKKKLETETELSNSIKENPSKTLEKIAKEMGWDYDK